MKWFDGPVAAAVGDAKRRNCVFVVYVRGDNELTREMDEIWENSETSEEMDKSGYIALRLEINSDAYKQFSQIYPVVCVPSTYFIGGNGVPLEITAGSITQEEFTLKMRNALHLHQQSKSTTPDPSTSAQPSTSQDTESANGHTASEAPPSQTANSSTASDESSGASANQASAALLEEKVEKARQIIAEKQAERAEQEKKEEIRREMERRKHGQESTTVIKRRDDDKAKQLALEIAKERAEDKAARQRVKEQIAKDRADRAEKYQKEKQEREETKRVQVEKQESTKRAVEEETVRNRSTIAKIQFRMADGTFVTNQFPATTTLREARQFVSEETGRAISSFILSTMYPRQLFTEEHMTSTLAELNLVPSAVVILLPNTSKHSAGTVRQCNSSSNGGVMALLMTVLAPLFAIWSYFTNLLSGGGAPRTGGSGRDNAHPSTSALRQQRPLGQSEAAGTSHDAAGNIRRFRNSADFGDDDSNTWNGNSTQQM